MTDYFLDPYGQLFEIDYSGTADFVELSEGDDGYNSERPYLNFVWIPNGIHGKIKPARVNSLVETYPTRWDGRHSEWPTVYLYFRNGILKEVIHPASEEEISKSNLDIPSY